MLKMEYRKLIAFGKNSFVISLPKPWIQQNKLKKGDLIHVEESVSNLVLSPQLNEEAKDDKTTTITVNGKDVKRIQRELISAYIQNYNTIIFSGSEIKCKAKEIQDFIQQLVALEILEQDSKKITARNFLNLNDISLDQIIRKMDIITRSMLKDCINIFNDDTLESIYLRDTNVNRFRFLVCRIVWYGLENPGKVFKKFNLSQIELFNYWGFSFNIEQIGDCIKRIARNMKETKLSKKSQQEFIDLLIKLEKDYLSVLKAFYDNNSEIAYNLVSERGNLIKECEDFFYKNKDIENIGLLTHNTKTFVINLNAIARGIYQGISSV